MSSNSQMVAQMASEGFARDAQCYIRGARTKLPNSALWMALKEKQNNVQNEDGTIYIYYTSTPTSTMPRYLEFANHQAGTRKMPIWMKIAKTKRWKRLGTFRFSEARIEHHDVIKRGKPYHTDRARTAILCEEA